MPGSKPPGSNSQSTRDSRCNKSPEAVSNEKFHHGSMAPHTKGSLLSRSLLLREISYVNVIHLPPQRKKKKTTSTEVFENTQSSMIVDDVILFSRKKWGPFLQVSISILSLGEGQ